MVLRNYDEQIELVRLIGSRIEQVKESIPQIETADEARSFVVGSVGTLRLLAEKLLSPDIFKDLDNHIDIETMIISGMIDRLRTIE